MEREDIEILDEFQVFEDFIMLAGPDRVVYDLNNPLEV